MECEVRGGGVVSPATHLLSYNMYCAVRCTPPSYSQGSVRRVYLLLSSERAYTGFSEEAARKASATSEKLLVSHPRLVEEFVNYPGDEGQDSNSLFRSFLHPL